MLIPDDPDVLYVNATISHDNLPLVMWSWRSHSGTLTLTDARQRAQAIFTAAAIAELEASVFEGVASLGQKGFARNRQAEETAIELLRLSRKFRPPLPEGLDVIYGAKTKQGLVVLDYYGETSKMSPEEARQHATQLLEVAEASESDRFFYIFLEDTMQIPKEEAHGLIQEFQKYRDRRILEDLYKHDY